ncbi:hypothetical protein Aab01nite_04030 [Paractinoplanes abujensis]|uniref:DUF3626 domain-containing protein n=1 Tax=Paractinoplanes abujensis TaxID=882441 RepID=A0A7W7G0N8_9ACTN|nr:DUF3626 domain-containing protein [Actinoplanes abujensis]MBB4691764.1 hypothetical protein [Actinoplanes abujensis]GID16813.1 hypothetical protein Aab01nite_04030 [Actinoplanes abujensis]
MSVRAERALAYVRELFPGAGPVAVTAPITVNFHPDRLLADGLTVAEHLAADGVYRSQFETRISNGGLTAYAGGERDRWEQRMFPGVYAGAAGRPIYGGLNLAGFADGASPRFGSCHLVLGASVLARATFSHGDSFTEPTVFGTAATFGAVWQALLDEVARTGSALNLSAVSPDAWVAALAEPRTGPGRALDHYVEAQVHGGLTLSEDVTAVVADPSFRGTPVEALLRGLAPQVRWSPGFVLPADEVPADLKGPQVPVLARAVADHYGVDVLDAAVLGRATHEPARWSSFGGPVEVLQLLKYVWHILVLRGVTP